MDKTPAYTRTADLTAAVLLQELELELDDEAYLTRTHGKPGTYQAGCRGHLCRYIERTRRREMRVEGVRQMLPEGVRPDVRPRKEQHWDAVIGSLIETLQGRTHEVSLAVDDQVGQRLGMAEMARFLALHQRINQRRAFVPMQRKSPTVM